MSDLAQNEFGRMELNGKILTFEIELNPEDATMWGIWEKISTDPDNDEIVASFASHAAAREWITRQLADPHAYFASRGI